MSAIISPCGQYRYRLSRDISEAGQVYAFFGINPSTADAEAEDATTRKWAGFCRANGARRYLAGNPFAFRATDVRMLAAVTDPVGPENEKHLLQIISDADVLVPCWGNSGKVPSSLRHHLSHLRCLLRDSGKPVKCFGFTSTGDPKHPLMLAYSTQLIPWNI